MNKITDIIGIEAEHPQSGEVRLWDEDPKTKAVVEAFLTNVPEGSIVFPYKLYNPNLAKHISGASVKFGPTRTASPRLFCDYLVMFRRAGMLCPVFIELAETKSSPFIGKKFEQLLCAMPVMELYRTGHVCVLNSEIIIDAPRFLLINFKDSKKVLRYATNVDRLHRDHPRVVRCLTQEKARISVFCYGGPNKIIKVARTTVRGSNRLDTKEIFKSLPTPEPSSQLTTKMKKAYHRLVEQEKYRQN